MAHAGRGRRVAGVTVRSGDDPREADTGVEELRAEPEPEWADAIRRGRRDLAARLRPVFASFDDDGVSTPVDRQDMDDRRDAVDRWDAVDPGERPAP